MFICVIIIIFTITYKVCLAGAPFTPVATWREDLLVALYQTNPTRRLAIICVYIYIYICMYIHT